MPINYDIETDYLYQKGFEVGYKRGLEIARKKLLEKRIEKLLVSKLLSPEQIAETFKVSLKHVLQIKQRLDAK